MRDWIKVGGGLRVCFRVLCAGCGFGKAQQSQRTGKKRSFGALTAESQALLQVYWSPPPGSKFPPQWVAAGCFVPYEHYFRANPDVQRAPSDLASRSRYLHRTDWADLHPQGGRVGGRAAEAGLSDELCEIEAYEFFQHAKLSHCLYKEWRAFLIRWTAPLALAALSGSDG